MKKILLSALFVSGMLLSTVALAGPITSAGPWKLVSASGFILKQCTWERAMYDAYGNVVHYEVLSLPKMYCPATP